MNIVLGFFLTVLVSGILGALAHEIDIRQAIRRYGHSNYATWLGRITGTLE